MLVKAKIVSIVYILRISRPRISRVFWTLLPFLAPYIISTPAVSFIHCSRPVAAARNAYYDFSLYVFKTFFHSSLNCEIILPSSDCICGAISGRTSTSSAISLQIMQFLSGFDPWWYSWSRMLKYPARDTIWQALYSVERQLMAWSVNDIILILDLFFHS
jgi:hypothetical protein